MSAADGSKRLRGIASFILIALIWGSTWLVIKDQISNVPASWSVTWRFALAAAAMFLLAIIRRDPLRLDRGGMWLAVVIGAVQFGANFQLVYGAQHFLTSGLVAVFFALLLVPNAGLARIFLGTPIGGRFMAGSAVALGGIGLLLLHEYNMAPPGTAVPLGVMLSIGAVLCASVGNVLQAGPVARRQAAIPLIAWSMAFGALANALFAAITTGSPVFDPRPEYLLGIFYLAIMGSVVTFPLYFALIRDWGPGKAAYNGVAVPVVAMALSTLFEGYRWSVLAGSGAMLAMIGLLIALSGRNPADRNPAGRNSQPVSSAASPSR